MNPNPNPKPSECEACSDYIPEEYTNEAGEVKTRNTLERINGLWLCPSCSKLEKDAILALHQSPKMQQFRIDKADSILNMSRAIDTSIKVREDLFNANTTAITELSDSIKQANPTLPEIEVRFLIAKELQTRIKHFQSVIFDLNNQLVDASTSQRATQSYLNTLANTLKAEQREKLRLSDLTYQPKSPSPKVNKPKVIKNKVSDEDIRRVTAELQKEFPDRGGMEFMVRMVIIARNVGADEAINIVRRSIRESE
jgi:hypothetical protein